MCKTILLVLGGCFCCTTACAEDLVEFLNGAKARGKVKQIRKDKREFDFETKVGTRDFTRTYPFSKVHAVTMNGRRFVLTPKVTSKPGTSRSKAEVEQLIARGGQGQPDWFKDTRLDYPRSLDLDWPLKAPQGWNNQKNMGQFIWDVVNPNPRRWRSGIKLVHHCLSLHQGHDSLVKRDMQTLGNMYFTLLQDYPRAAFWYQQADVAVSQLHGVRLAECYWRLGNRQMALEKLRARALPLAAIKLLAEMGELERALRLAAAFEKFNSVNDARLLAADALRQAGRSDEAIDMYQKVFDSNKFRNKDYEQRMKGRARDSMEAIRVYEQVDVSNVPEGSYEATSIGYNGQIKIAVDVAAGKITTVRVVSHREKQFYAALTDTPQQILDNQGIDEVDATSGATITSQAIVNATAKALAEGTR